MTWSSAARSTLRTLVAALLLAGAGRAQVVALFAENFEGPPGPPGMVGAYTETDPLFGGPAPTLWHLEGQCGAFPVGGYNVAASSAPFSSIFGTPGSALVFSSGDDGYSGRLLLPFTFPHFGAPFQFGLIDVNRNGFVATFPGGGGGTDYDNQLPGSTIPPNGVIGPWWDDTVHTAGFTVLAVQGSAPNQRVVIEWHDLEHYPGNASGENATFQAVIHESGVLEFHYDNATFATGGDPWDATCGTENFDGTTGKDATGQANTNSTFPSTGFVLTPTPPAIPTVPPGMGTKAAAYNQGDVGLYSYNTGGQTTGALESPPVVSTSATSTLVLVFDYTKETESSTTFDQCFVETAPSGTGAWSTVTQLTGIATCPGPEQTQLVVLPPAVAGTSFQHRFRFDSVDGFSNDFRGWYVDNVRVVQAPGGSVTAFAENFETGTVPGSTVGNMPEEDPFGFPVNTLWHSEQDCDSGSSSGTYTVTSLSPPGTFPSILGSPSASTIFGPGNDDPTSFSIPLPSPFSYFGIPKTTFQVNNNGWIAFDQSIGGGYFVNQFIPDPGTPNDALFPWWDDLHTCFGGNVLYDTTGSGDLIVEWNTEEQYPCNGSGENATLQVVLHPAPANTIEFRYDGSSFIAGPWTATIGLEDNTGSVGVDITGLGSGNPVFPTTDFLLTHTGGGPPMPTPIPAPLAGHAAAYNQGDFGLYTYNNGSQNEGAIRSPSFTLPGGTVGVSVSFDYLKETEGGGSLTFDQCFVEGRGSTSAPWDSITQIGGIQSCAAGGATASVGQGTSGVNSLVTAGGGQVRFRFDTVDSVSNDFRGWYVDNVSVVAQTVALATPFGSGCPGAGGCTPSISAAGLPYAGNDGFQILMTGATPGTLAMFVIGFSASTPPCPLSIPFALSSLLPGNTCSLLVCPDVLPGLLPVSSGGPCGGSASVTFPIFSGVPTGATAHFQWIVLNLGVLPSPTAISASPGMHVTVL